MIYLISIEENVFVDVGIGDGVNIYVKGSIFF